MILQKVLGDILHENSVIETYVYTYNLQRKPVLSDPDIKNHLEELYRNLLLLSSIKPQTILKICRKYYISKLLAEDSPNKSKKLAASYLQIQKSEDGNY